MAIWALSRGDYVASEAKESSFQSTTMRLIHRLVVSAICYHAECDKVPIGDLFYMWCFIHIEVFLNIDFTLAFYLSCLVVGSLLWSMIWGGRFVTCLQNIYSSDDSI